MISKNDLSILLTVGLNPSLDECPQLRVMNEEGLPEVASHLLFDFYFMVEIEQLIIDVVNLRLKKVGAAVRLNNLLFSRVKPLEECVQEQLTRGKRIKPDLLFNSDEAALLQASRQQNLSF